jgi:hypothetical protein
MPSLAVPAIEKQPCYGSCHCGFTKYIVFLTLPHPFSSRQPPLPTQQEIYRCNCTACHKMGFLHVHPAHPADDFMLLAPLNPDHELGVYQCYDMRLKYYFCAKCGVRCFTFGGGEGEKHVANLSGPESNLGYDGDDSGSNGNKEGKRREVWRAKWDGKAETRPYLSVNGTTIEHREDFDLRILTEDKRVQYFDGRSVPEEERKARWNRPHYGGCY